MAEWSEQEKERFYKAINYKKKEEEIPDFLKDIMKGNGAKDEFKG